MGGIGVQVSGEAVLDPCSDQAGREEADADSQESISIIFSPVANTHSVKLRIRQFFQMSRVRRRSRTVKYFG